MNWLKNNLHISILVLASFGFIFNILFLNEINFFIPISIVYFLFLSLVAFYSHKSLLKDFIMRNNLFKAAIEATPYAIAVYDKNNVLIECNKAYRHIHKKSFDKNPNILTYSDLMYASAPNLDDKDEIDRWVNRRIKTQNQGDGSPKDRLYPDGRWLRVSKYKMPCGGNTGYGIDITDLKQRELSLKDAEKQYNALTQVAPVGIWQLSSKGKTLFLNNAALDIFSIKPKYYTQDPPILDKIRVIQDDTLLDKPHTFKILLTGKDPINIEAEIQGKNSKSLYITRSKLLKNSDGENSYIYVIIDISSKKKAENNIRYLAKHDSLTGLVNRNTLNNKLELLIEKGEKFAFVLIDLDYFKNINDSLGHQIGDELLKEVSSRIKLNLRADDTASRLGGDEFAVLLPNTCTLEQANAMLKRLYDSFSVPAELDHRLIHISASTGVSIFPEHGKNLRDLIHHADIALYHQKKIGRGSFTIFEDKLALDIQQKKLLESDLRRALSSKNELYVYYQPQYDLKTMKISGVEALVRWHNKRTESWVSPVDFIPTAEKNSLIFDLDKYVLSVAAKQMHSWHCDGYTDLTLASNLSTMHFKSDLFESMIKEVLNTSQLNAYQLELEITESLFLEDQNQALNQLEAVRKLGIRIAIDDFGTGYSSLGYLNNLPVDCLKIDRSFIENYGKGHYHKSIVEFIIALGKNLNLNIVAEGIEKPEQLERLIELECSHAQGFYLSMPQPASEITTLLQKSEFFSLTN